MLKRGFLTQQKTAAKKPLRSNLPRPQAIVGETMVNLEIEKPVVQSVVQSAGQYVVQNTVQHTIQQTYFDLLPRNVKHILMQWIWYTQPKINWMGDGRDESIRLARMMRLQRIATEILKINNVRIYGGDNVKE